MDENLYYLCLTLSVTWLVFFVFLFIQDRNLKDLKRRLEARQHQDAQ